MNEVTLFGMCLALAAVCAWVSPRVADVWFRLITIALMALSLFGAAYILAVAFVAYVRWT